MELFPYPVRLFSCRPYAGRERIRADAIEQEYFVKLNAFAGPVAGETGIPGLKLDFRVGLRLLVPRGDWQVRITDGETGQVFFDEALASAVLVSEEKYFVPWHIEVKRDGRLVFAHDCALSGMPLHLVNLSAQIGDTLTVLPAAQAAKQVYGGRVTLFCPEYLRPLVRNLYPELPLVSQDAHPEDTYAAFYLGVGAGYPLFSPLPDAKLPMLALAPLAMGLADGERPPVPDFPREIAEPYVCIGVQASATPKGWLWPNGWEEVVVALRQAGYRVLCIDKEREQTERGFTNKIPAGAEDFTGDIPLVERAKLLAHAEFFIGLGSGLAWLAWTVRCPVVMIAGFTLPWFEFPEAERAYNPRVCCGCTNLHPDLTAKFPMAQKADGSICHMDCQRLISPAMVLRAVMRLLARKARGEKF